MARSAGTTLKAAPPTGLTDEGEVTPCSREDMGWGSESPSGGSGARASAPGAGEERGDYAMPKV